MDGPQHATSLDECVDALAGGLDCDRRRNLFQALTVLSCMTVGAIAGAIFLPDAPLPIRAGAGAVLGMLAGALISGLVLRLVPAREAIVSRADYVKKYLKLRRHLPYWKVAMLACHCFIVLAIYFCLFGDPVVGLGALILFFAAGITAAGCYGSIHTQVQNWTCPNCGTPFGYSGAFAGPPYTCDHCDLSTE